jgi:hypothetical protein
LLGEDDAWKGWRMAGLRCCSGKMEHHGSRTMEGMRLGQASSGNGGGSDGQVVERCLGNGQAKEVVREVECFTEGQGR